ncbi:unnamed protein product, partial [marine sediment metagenome]
MSKFRIKGIRGKNTTVKRKDPIKIVGFEKWEDFSYMYISDERTVTYSYNTNLSRFESDQFELKKRAIYSGDIDGIKRLPFKMEKNEKGVIFDEKYRFKLSYFYLIKKVV